MKRYKLLATAAAVFALGTAPLFAQGKSGNAPKGGAPKTTSTAPTTHGNSGGAKNPNAGGPKASAPTTTASGARHDHCPEHHDRLGAQEQWQRDWGRQEDRHRADDDERVDHWHRHDHGHQHDDHADNHDGRDDHHHAHAIADDPQQGVDKGDGQSRAVGESDGDAAPRDDARAGQQRLPQPGPVPRGVERVEEPRAGVRRPAEGDDGGRHEPGSGRQVRPDVAAGAGASSGSDDRYHDADDRHHDTDSSGRDDDHDHDQHHGAEVVARDR